LNKVKNKNLWLLFGLLILILFVTGCPQTEKVQIKKAKFIGSKKCQPCHKREYKGWQETLHALGIQDPDDNPKALLGNFETKAKARTFTKRDVDLVFGVQWKQRYLTKRGDDFLILPAQYNLATNEWVPYHPEDWKERPFSKKCAGCHATGVTEDNLLGIEMNVGCEACHGPGSIHVEKRGKEEPLAIVNPARLPSDQGAMVCGRCHSRGSDRKTKLPFAVRYLPGEWLFLTFNPLPTSDEEHFFPGGFAKAHHLQYIDWRQSAHAQHGVTCISCHTTHSKGANNKFQTRLPGNNLCRSCHKALQAVRAHSIHSFNDCIACHMPLTAKSAIQGDIHSHTFKIIPPLDSITKPELVNSCSPCHTEETPQELQEDLEKVSPFGAQTPSKKPVVGIQLRPPSGE
jgi:predicted CXXCH cytochrome family protein